MPHHALATLQEILRPHVGLSKSRLETLCLIVVGMISTQTVNLSHLACERPRQGTESGLTRLGV